MAGDDDFGDLSAGEEASQAGSEAEDEVPTAGGKIPVKKKGKQNAKAKKAAANKKNGSRELQEVLH